MPELLISIPIAVLFLIALHESGRLILKLLSAADVSDDPLDSLLLRFASGFTILSFLITIIAFVHLLNSVVLWIILVLLVASGFYFGRKDLADSFKTIGRTWSRIRSIPLNAILAVIIAVALLMDLVLTFVPTTAWDSLTYHYPLPASWLKSGGFIPIPGNCYSELPCGSEMLFAMSFGLGGIRPDHTGAGPLAANHLTWLAGLFSCLCLISVSRLLGKQPAEDKNINGRYVWNEWTPGLVASVAFLSLPIVFVEEMEGGYIENFLVFFTLAILILLLRFRDNHKPEMLLPVGLLAGGLLASKHTGLFFNVLVLLILVVWLIRSKASGKLWGKLVLAAVIAVLLASPWYLKSYLNTGDPAFPFVTKALDPNAPVPDIMYWSNPNIERSLLGFITYISRLSWDESLTQFKFRLLTWYYIPMLPFVIYWSIFHSRARVTGLITWVLITLIYIFAPGEPRYMLAAWGLYASLGAWSVFYLFRQDTLVARTIVPILLILPIAFSMVHRTQEIKHRLPAISGIVPAERYFEESLDIHPLAKYINDETSDDAGVVMVEPRVFYIERPYIIWYPFPTEPTNDWPDLEPEDLLEQWRSEGMEYVLVTYGPNYRALTIAYADGLPESYPGLSDFFYNIPDWVKLRATYAESVIGYNDSGILDTVPDWEELRTTDNFDVFSIQKINELVQLGYLETAYRDERSGIIYRIVYPEDLQ